MTGKAVGWAFDQPVKNPTRKLVLVCLADAADDHGICWPGFGKISKKTSLSRRTIIRAIEELESDGLLERVNRPTGTGRWTSNAYRLPIADECIDDHPLSSLFKPSVTEALPSVTEALPSVTEALPSVTEAPLETPYTPPLTEREREPLSREAFLRGINGGYQAGEFGDEFDHLTESEIANQAAECFDRWGDDLRGRNPVLILRSWLRKGQSLGTVRKAPKQSEAGDGALQESKRPEPENELQPQHERIKRYFSEAEFNAWIRPLVFTDGTIYAPTNFHKDYIRQNFSDRIEAALGTFFHYQTAEKELERA